AAIDARDRGLRLFHAVEIGHAHRIELHLFELRQYGIAESGGGNAGAVGDDEDSAFDDWSGHGAWCRACRKRYNPARLTLTSPAWRAKGGFAQCPEACGSMPASVP